MDQQSNAKSIGNKLGGSVIGLRISFEILLLVVIYVLSFTVLPSLLTSSIPTIGDGSLFVTYYRNTFILNTISVILLGVIIFASYKLAFKIATKKKVFYKFEAKTIKSRAQIFLWIFFGIAVLFGISNVYSNTTNFSSRTEAIDSMISTYQELKEDGISSLEAYFLGFDSPEDFENDVDTIVANLEATKVFIPLLIIVYIVGFLVQVGMELLMILSTLKKIDKVALDDSNLERDIYGNIYMNQNMNPNMNVNQNMYMDPNMNANQNMYMDPNMNANQNMYMNTNMNANQNMYIDPNMNQELNNNFIQNQNNPIDYNQ